MEARSAIARKLTISSKELNQKLAELNHIFSAVEDYDEQLNMGLRSLKNIGVWLLVYALIDADDQLFVLQEIADKANLKSNEQKEILRCLVNELAQSRCLLQIIYDYKKANGQFVLNVSSNISGIVKNKLNQIDSSGELKKYITTSYSLPTNTISLSMENSIQFTWLPANKNRFKSCTESINKFKDDQIGYLTANDNDHSLSYDFVEYHGNYYHVVRFDTLDQQQNESSVYFIEAVAKENNYLLRDHYFDIISRSSKLNKDGYIRLLDAMQKKGSMENIDIDEKTEHIDVRWYDIGVPVIYKFHFTFHFPQLADKLQTIENRLGIYSFFKNKNIADNVSLNLCYMGKRELSYDKDGGSIYNSERFSVLCGSCSRRNPKIIKNIYITLTIDDLFLFAFAAKHQSDFYPFIIADPRNQLENHFLSSYVSQNDDSSELASIFGGAQAAYLFDIASSFFSSISRHIASTNTNDDKEEQRKTRSL